jgi:hypothetical protein
MKKQSSIRERMERDKKITLLHRKGIKAEFLAVRFGLRKQTVYSIVSAHNKTQIHEVRV